MEDKPVCCECKKHATWINFIPGCVPWLTCEAHCAIAGAFVYQLDSERGQQCLRTRQFLLSVFEK